MAKPWSAGCDESRTSGAEGGPGKRIGSNPETAPRPDPYIIGLDKSAIGTLVERTSRYTMLLHLPRMDDFGETPTVKNGPPLAGHGAEAVNSAIVAQIGGLPDQLRRSLTWDQDGELAKHVQLKDRWRYRGLLLRPALTLATPQQREHQRALAPVLPQGH